MAKNKMTCPKCKGTMRIFSRVDYPNGVSEVVWKCTHCHYSVTLPLEK